MLRGPLHHQLLAAYGKPAPSVSGSRQPYLKKLFSTPSSTCLPLIDLPPRIFLFLLHTAHPAKPCSEICVTNDAGFVLHWNLKDFNSGLGVNDTNVSTAAFDLWWSKDALETSLPSTASSHLCFSTVLLFFNFFCRVATVAITLSTRPGALPSMKYLTSTRETS